MFPGVATPYRQTFAPPGSPPMLVTDGGRYNLGNAGRSDPVEPAAIRINPMQR